MQFAPTDTQEAVRGVAAEALDRSDESVEAGWRALADAGLLALPVPQQHGGEGLGLDEVGVLLGFAVLAFGVPVRGSLLALLGVCLLAALTFGALGLLIASRAQTIEGVSGLMNGKLNGVNGNHVNGNGTVNGAALNGCGCE